MTDSAAEPWQAGALFLIDKPAGPTSHDMVRLLRRLTGTRRVGHGGTLDPLATGLLPVLVGRATRLAEYLGEHEKSYRATIRLGIRTDTDDAEGDVLEVAEVPPLDGAQLQAALGPFRGRIEQTPPRYSAVKVAGVVAHRAARRGDPIDVPSRTVTVHELTVESLDLPLITLAMRVSTGTYVRALARDLGAALGCGAHVTEMRRTHIGPVEVSQGHSPEALEAARDAGRLQDRAVSPALFFDHWPQLRLEDVQVQRVLQGQAIRGKPVVGARRALALAPDGAVLAVLRSDPEGPGRWQPEKVLWSGGAS